MRISFYNTLRKLKIWTFGQRYAPPNPSVKVFHRLFCLFPFVFKTYCTAWDLLVTLTNFQVTLTILWVTLTSLLKGKAFFFFLAVRIPLFSAFPLSHAEYDGFMMGYGYYLMI